jgi:hypothetical protein
LFLVCCAAERQSSFGLVYHPGCLRCQECNKKLLPGKHAEAEGQNYCEKPCYASLFGPQGFGRGMNESHSSYGEREIAASPEKQSLRARISSFNEKLANDGMRLTVREVI